MGLSQVIWIKEMLAAYSATGKNNAAISCDTLSNS